jgi:hypothetical protein
MGMGDEAELETEYETERVEDELSAALARLEETTRRIDALLESGGAGAVQSGRSEWEDAKEDARAVSTADDEEE